ncbi:MAG: hypothetical protein AB2556_23430 [Candidatus Thiodiazotropha sp.]
MLEARPNKLVNVPVSRFDLIVGGSLVGNPIKLGGKAKDAIFSAGRSVAAAFGARVGALAPKIKQVVANAVCDVAIKGKDAALEAAKAQLSPDKIADIATNLTRGDLKAAAAKAKARRRPPSPAAAGLSQSQNRLREAARDCS